MSEKRSAPRGDLSTYIREPFVHRGKAYDVYRKGSGPAVLVVTEFANISPLVVGFADRLVALGLSAVLPDPFGRAGDDLRQASVPVQLLHMVKQTYRLCVRREFTLFALGRTSPVVRWLRALAAFEHERCGGPGVGVVGMCISGGFALAMAADDRVLAPVLSQPSLPLAWSERMRASIDCDPDDLERVASRCANEGLRVLGLRFEGDKLSPGARFDMLRERLGDAFIAVEIAQEHGHPDEPLSPHAVLTAGLIDEPGEPTRAALDQVLRLLQTKLLATDRAQSVVSSG